MSRFKLLPNHRSTATALGMDPMIAVSCVAELCLESKKKIEKKKAEKKIKPDPGERLFV